LALTIGLVSAWYAITGASGYMHKVITALLVPLATFIPSVAIAQVTTTATGSGVVVGAHGEILTNFHVVEGCENITVQLPLKKVETATLIAHDQKNDLAVVQIKTLPASVATFRGGTSLRAGDTIVALGYPLSGLLASTANLSTGIVSALAGLGDDTRYLQISAPVQPGNSGGPLLDTSGHLVGIVTSKLNALRMARFTGDVPQNVNFAIKGEIARAFLDSKGINYQIAQSTQNRSVAEVGDVARPFTIFVECKQAAPRTTAAVKHPPNQPPPPTQKPSVAKSLANPPALNEQAPATYKVRFDTTRGPFVVEVTRAWAPRGADRFYNLVKNGFYDNVRFFRVISGFMVQFGINGDPAITANWRTAQIPDDPVTQSNTRGTITFAMAGPNTRTSQVFINFADNPRLDQPGFAPFGKVVSGMNVVDVLNAEYGEGAPRGRGPDQSRLQSEGNDYLMKEYPRMDYIKKATIER
jgi:peptidyl-prolyl cis-trans isomerase A (cyclophilin A)